MHGTANRGTRRALAGFVGGVLLLNGITACGGGRAGASSSAHDDSPAAITITPAANTSAVRPDAPVTVQASGGTLDNVTLQADGQSLDGDYNQQHTQWQSRWALKPGATFSVQAAAKNPAGKPVTVTDSFTTQHVAHTFSVSQDWIMEGNKGSSYGVGMPIILNFDQPIHNKAEVEKSLEVTADKPVEGAWHWVGDDQVVYRTKTYWPAHQTVHLTAHLTGVRGRQEPLRREGLHPVVQDRCGSDRLHQPEDRRDAGRARRAGRPQGAGQRRHGRVAGVHDHQRGPSHDGEESAGVDDLPEPQPR